MSTTNPPYAIPKLDDFKIPVHFEDDARASYLAQLKSRFQQLYTLFEKEDKIHFKPVPKEDVLSRMKAIQTAIVKLIHIYLKGNPSDAFIAFEAMILKFNLTDDLIALQQYKVPKTAGLFRIQREYDKEKTDQVTAKEGYIRFKQPADLFHPPFNKRRAVSTNRFSIPGYPCLYVSDSLFTSFSECFHREDQASDILFHSIVLKPKRPLYFIDLSADNIFFPSRRNLFPGILPKPDQPENTEALDITSLLGYLNVYQLIFACHTKVNYIPSYTGERFHFKAEYIIPQLLLQWLNKKRVAIDGIRYKSCTGEPRFPDQSPHYNYVLPVRSNLDNGFCPALSSLFACSKVYSHLRPLSPTDINPCLAKITQKLSASKYKPFSF